MSTIGGSIDVNSLVSQLMTVEQQPLTKLTTTQSSYQSKISAFGTLKNALSSFQDSIKNIIKSDTFSSASISTSDGTVASASISTAANVVNDSAYNVSVKSLASSQKLVADRVASLSTVIGGGELTIDFGTITGNYNSSSMNYDSGATFQADTERVKKITIPSNANLKDISEAINKSGSGVSSTIINDGNGYRLMLSSNNTGTNNSMQIKVNGDTGLSNLLTFDVTGNQNMKQNIEAKDAKIVIDNLDIVSQSNTVSNAIPGVDLKLSKIGDVQVNTKTDYSNAVNKIKGFVSSYNSLTQTMSNLGTSSTSKTAILSGDSTIRNIDFGLKQGLTKTNEDNMSLSSLGISFQKDGTLLLDQSKLEKAMSKDFTKVVNFFSGDTSILKSINTSLNDLTQSNGTIDNKTKGLKNTVDNIEKQKTAMQKRLDSIEQRYKTQFTTLDSLLTGMSQTSTYLSKQFG